MSNFLTVKKNTLAVLNKAAVLAQTWGYKTSAEKILGIKQQMEQKYLTIMTVGEARRGKSSTLNLFLNEKEPLFPVDVNVCTNVVTVVKYGEEESVTVHILGEDGKIYKEKTTRDKIGDYVSEQGNPENHKNVSLLEIAIPNVLLKEGIILVDTPGVGSLNVAHAETTYRYLSNADIVLFVSDANSGYTVSELDFMKRSYSFCKNIIFTVTKMDTNKEYLNIVEDNKNKIAEQLDIKKEDIEIIPVSNVAKLRYLKTGNKATYRISNFEKLEKSVWSMVARTRFDIMIMPFLSSLNDELTNIRSSILTQSGMLDKSQQNVSQLIKAYEDEITKIKDYQNDGAEWKNDINNQFQQMNIEINRTISETSDEAVDLLDDTINRLNTKICQKKNYEKLLMDINTLITLKEVSIRTLVGNTISGQITSTREKLQLNLNVNEEIIENNPFQGENIDIKFPKRKLSDKLANGGTTIARNTSGGATVGTIIGGAIGGLVSLIGGPVAVPVGIEIGAAIGAAAGTLFGSGKGIIDSLQKYDNLDVNTVRRETSKYISSSVKGVSSSISLITTELRHQVIKSLDKELKQKIESIQENSAKIKENINLASQDIPKKRALYNNQLKQLDEFENYIETIADEAENIKKSVKPVATAVSPESENVNPTKKTSYDFL